MSSAAIIAIAVGVVVILAALTFVTLARKSDVRGAGALSGETRRRDRSGREAHPAETAAEAAPTAREVEAQGAIARYGTTLAPAREVAPVPWMPPDPEAIGVSRRQFFNRATVTLTSAGLGAFFAAGFVAFLWPTATGGFGQPVTVGKIDEIKDGIREGNGFFYAPSARTWITAYPPDALPAAAQVYPDNILQGMEQGLVALYQKCPHLGCRVPQCVTSQWFECPCHGSQYNQVGEKKAGPAPRGMDRFPLTVGGNGDVTVDTGVLVPGPPIGTNTTGQEAEGPHCITGGGEH
jgi:cytochrome b6-f complex iron-sulfur subunit